MLIPVGDKEKLIAAMEKLIEDKDLARRIGMNAERDSRRFNANAVLQQWDEVVSL